MRVLIFQTGEPLHCVDENARPMRAMNLANRLISHGHTVDIVSTAFYHQKKRHRSDAFKVVKISSELNIYLIPSTGYEKNIGHKRLIDHAVLAINLKRALSRGLVPQPDVAFVGYPPIEAAYVLANWLGTINKPYYLDVKDQWPEYFLEAVPEKFKKLGKLLLSPYFIMAKSVMRRATGCGGMSKSYLEWINKFSCRQSSKFDGIYPLTSPEEKISELSLSHASNFWDSIGVRRSSVKFRLIFVGSLSPAFSFESVYEAACVLTNPSEFQFVICGDGPLHLELRERFDTVDNVIFPGWIDRAQMHALAARSNAAIMPYNNSKNFVDNIPNKFIDAFQFGLPVLSPLKGEIESLMLTSRVGLQYSSEIKGDLARSIELLASDRTLWEEMSTACKEVYRNQFDFSSVYDGLSDNLKNMAAKAAS